MKKRILSVVLTVALVASLAIGLVVGLTACNDKKDNSNNDKTLNVGAVYIGDAQETYTEAHMRGITAAIQALEAQGYTVNLNEKTGVGEEVTPVHTAIGELVSWSKSGKQKGHPTIIITNSYGHQNAYGDISANQHYAQLNPDIEFVAMTGDLAAGTHLDNYHNAFNATYQSRYVAGVAAGYKLQELVASNQLTAQNFDGSDIRLGYVGAFPFAEVKSGYTAFYLGVKSVVGNVKMHVKFTGSWYDPDAESEAAKALIAEGCVIISQHADSAGAPSACEEAKNNGKLVYNVGYNVSVISAAPHCALTSATNNWSVFYTYAFKKVADGEKFETDWSAGYEAGAVDITELNKSLYTTDPTAKINAVVEKLRNGTLQVFDCSKFTLAESSNYTLDANGHLTAYAPAGLNGQAVKTANGVTYFEESVLRSAPYFDLDIIGINPDTFSFD